MEKLLTISIAAYNMENYIRCALDPLVNASFIDELEIFVVDDGGTDSTLAIADQYAEKYPKSIFPVHKENGGYGTVVNYSIEHATGKYFKILDGDDWFNQDGMINLIHKLKEQDVDIVITPVHGVKADHTIIIDRVEDVPLDVVLPIKIIDNISQLTSAMITYRTEILIKSGLHLPSHTLYTDTLYCIIPLSICSNILFLDKQLYYYRLGREDQSMNIKQRLAHTHDISYVAELLCCFYRDRSFSSPYFKRMISGIYVQLIRLLFYLYLSEQTQESIACIKNTEKRIHEISKEIYCSISKRRKFGFVVSLLRLSDYRLIWILKLIPKSLLSVY